MIFLVFLNIETKDKHIRGKVIITSVTIISLPEQALHWLEFKQKAHQ